jgi:hypothetical protein
MGSQSLGRRDVLRQGAGLGLAMSAIGLAVTGTAALAQDGTPASGGETDIEKLKSDVRSEYDKAKSDIEALGEHITDATKDAYDELKKGLDAIGDEITKAENIPSDSVHEVKRAYRDIQHALEDLDLEAHRAMHKTDDATVDSWYEVRKGLHGVHKRIDHVIDAV